MPLTSGEQLRRNPQLELVCVGGDMQFCDHAARRQYRANSLDVGLLRLLMDAALPRTAKELEHTVRAATGCSAREAAAEIERLFDAGFLTNVDPLEEARRVTFANHGWGPAYDYQRHTELLEKIDWADPDAVKADVALMRRYLKAETAPDLYSTTQAVSSVPLPKSLPPLPSLGVCLQTEKDVSTTPTSCLDRLGTLLYLSFGQTSTRRLPVTGTHVTKTSPSGGSRHPTETYVVSFEVDGLEPGLYHYDVQHHRLDLLEAGEQRERFQRDVVMHADRPGFNATFGLVLTSEVERSMFRYRESRSYRVIHHDVGHLLQTTALVARGLHMNIYRGYTLRDADVERWLKVDGLREPVVGYAVLR